jgi:hypothetical protein
LNDFLRSFPLAELRPDSQTIRHAAGVIPYGLSDAKGHFAFNFDGAGPVEVNFNLPQVTTQRNGETTIREKFQHRDREKYLEGPTFEQGIALRLNER